MNMLTECLSVTRKFLGFHNIIFAVIMALTTGCSVETPSLFPESDKTTEDGPQVHYLKLSAADASITIKQNSSLAVTLSAVSKEGAELTYILVNLPSHGKISGNVPSLTYSPDIGYHGTDSFTFKASDGKEESNVAKISVLVNDAPVAIAQSAFIDEDFPRNIVLGGSDANGDALTFKIVSSPSHGSVTLSGVNVFYTPSLNYNGTDSFSFNVNDGNADSNVAIVSLVVRAWNDRPVAIAQNVTTPEDTPVSLVLQGSDIDGDTLSFAIGHKPKHGKLTGSGANRIYTPEKDYNGEDSFDFTVSDSNSVTSAVAKVSLTISPVDDLSVASSQSVSTDQNVAIPIVLNVTNVDSDPLTYTFTNPTKGTLSGTAPNITYTPRRNLSGTDSFTFKVNDGVHDSNIAVISITVVAAGSAPVAQDQTVLAANYTQVITLQATDAEGNHLSYTVVNAPAHGTLSGQGANLIYTVTERIDSDSFSFKANDGTNDSNIAVVTIRGPLGAKAITSGSNHTCAILSNDKVKCWGDNAYFDIYGLGWGDGQLGLGDINNRGDDPNEMGDNLPYVDLGTGKKAKSISAGNFHTCAILNDDSVKCWGNNFSGQLGLGDKNNRGNNPNEMGDNLPVVNLGTNKFARVIKANGYQTCAILNDNSTKCWGNNKNGQLGLGDLNNRGDNPNEMGDNLPAVNLGTNKFAKELTGGNFFSCAILNDDSVKCWGEGYWGELGTGMFANSVGWKPNQMGDNLPIVNLGTNKSAKAISGGNYHACVVLNDDSVTCWGSFRDDWADGFPLVVKSVIAGHNYDCALMTDNSVSCPTLWGGAISGSSFIVQLGTNKFATALSGGYENACAILNDRSIKCWGYNGNGELGLGDKYNRGNGVNDMGDFLPFVNLGFNP